MNPTPPSPAKSRGVTRLVLVAGAAIAGAGGGWWIFGGSPLALLGVLIGLLLGRTLADWVYPPANDGGFLPQAHWSVILGVGGWLAVICFWALVYREGFLHGEGSSLLILYIVLPVTVIGGLVGGPMASAAAHRARQQIEAGKRPAKDQRLARVGLFLGRLMSLALLGFLAWLLMTYAG